LPDVAFFTRFGFSSGKIGWLVKGNPRSLADLMQFGLPQVGDVRVVGDV